ncbi:uncharacterized protein DFL_002391 [Arthrobotrys flagrans]|uniref:GPI inositol-deacylase n=1 Tax=Arthrobotrys flagrans TaxID=97331 RepID=A0A437AAQ7_ARTFL|nr:hypothetical protein DFL_002391 [Arthrobotrys flagrans]
MNSKLCWLLLVRKRAFGTKRVEDFWGLAQSNHPTEDIVLDIVAIADSTTTRMGHGVELNEVDQYKYLQKSIQKHHFPGTDQKTGPLALLGHSYGGLIATEAFVRATWNKKYTSIHLSTVQILSFGVPYKGINLDQIDIVKTTRTPRSFDKNSAVLGLPGDLEEDYDIDGDHISLVQFTNRTDRTYTTIVVGYARQWVIRKRLKAIHAFNKKLSIPCDIIDIRSAPGVNRIIGFQYQLFFISAIYIAA